MAVCLWGSVLRGSELCGHPTRNGTSQCLIAHSCVGAKAPTPSPFCWPPGPRASLGKASCLFTLGALSFLSFLQGQPSHDRPFSPFNLPFRASRGEMIFGLLVSWSSRTGSLKPFHGCSVGSPAIGGGSQDFLGSRLCWETPPWPGAPQTLLEREQLKPHPSADAAAPLCNLP